MTSAELLDAAMPEAILSYMSQLIPLMFALDFLLLGTQSQTSGLQFIPFFSAPYLLRKHIMYTQPVVPTKEYILQTS